QRVDNGSRLVNEAGVTMNEILKSVTDVTEIMKQIAAASEEQSKGISQVGVAITEMDSVTQQNASLVEQVSAAASALERQTQELRSSVVKFRLSQHDNADISDYGLPVKTTGQKQPDTITTTGTRDWISF
uniref:methyl-accepting chemotaxis protein n=1 Tax=Erwinia sp. V71 TaxID=3369424 RepID=UPI003F62B08F